MIKVFDKSPSKHGTLDDLSQIYAQQLFLEFYMLKTNISKLCKTKAARPILIQEPFSFFQGNEIKPRDQILLIRFVSFHPLMQAFKDLSIPSLYIRKQ